MRQYSLLVYNSLTLLFTLAMNFLAGSDVFNGVSVGDISERYDSLFTPAGYAFAIWGIIYLLLILFTGYQWYAWLKSRNDKELKMTGIWYGLANLANGFWIIAWLNDAIGVSVVLIFVLLFSLIMLTIRLKLELWDAPVRTLAFVWWPISIYLGWIIVASVANVSAWLVSINWEGGFISEPVWTIIMIVAATIIYLLLVFYRNMREAALAGIWALIAIAVKQWQINHDTVAAAITGALILFAVIGWHGYKNKETSPFQKIKRGEV